MKKAFFRGLGVLVIATVSAFAQSQPPVPTPAASVQNQESKASPEAKKPSVDQSDAKALSAAVDQLTSAIKDETRAHQQDSAENNPSWHWWAVNGINFLIAAFTGALMWVAWQQWKTYERQADLMSDSLRVATISANASKEAADAAKATVETMERNARKQLRAYVTLKFGKDKKAEDETNETFTFFIKNSGQTPALNLSSNFGWRQEPGPNARWPKGVEPIGTVVDIGGSKAPLGAGEVTPLHSPIDRVQDPHVFRRALVAANLGQCTLFFVGQITYDDVFGEHHVTNYCMTHVAKKPLGHTLLCAENNSST